MSAKDTLDPATLRRRRTARDVEALVSIRKPELGILVNLEGCD